jgi:hypothetical protein
MFHQLNTKNKKIVYAIIVFIVLVVAFLFWDNYRIDISQRPRKPAESPLVLPIKCGIQNCHGLDITCGQNVPEVCDMSYRLGDKCRQLASCQIIRGTCTLVKSAEFDACKSCIENCRNQFGSNPEKAFACEAKCGPKTEESQ